MLFAKQTACRTARKAGFGKGELVASVRFERTTFSFGGRHSNPLSYEAEHTQSTRLHGDCQEAFPLAEC